MTSSAIDGFRHQFLGVADSTFAFRTDLQRRLREIDRKALNAQILVKRHGKALIGYGVVAQSFREGAQQLQSASILVQQAIEPLIYGFMRTLQGTQQTDKLQNLPESVRSLAPHLMVTLAQHQRAIEEDARRTARDAQRLMQALGRFQSVVAEIEYVVVNGRIEAALKGSGQAALAQVSADMDKAIRHVRELLRTYRDHVDPLF